MPYRGYERIALGRNRAADTTAASAACATLAPMRVVIADDHRLVLDGIKRALESGGNFEIVGETTIGPFERR